MMKQLLYFTFVLAGLISAQQGFAQIGVGTETPQGALDITSTDKGLLVPRVALTNAGLSAPVVNPQGGDLVNGTLVYNTATAGSDANAVVPGFYYWENGMWKIVNMHFPYAAETINNALYLQSSSEEAYAITGIASSTTGSTAGVFGGSQSPDGAGIAGINTSMTGAGKGVYGVTFSPDGIAVAGQAIATEGTNYGVYGTSDSATGYGGFFSTLSTATALGTGIGKVQFGNLAGTGTRMVVADENGILSTQPASGFTLPYTATTTGNGIHIESSDPISYPIVGFNTANTGSGDGVLGKTASPDGNGVHGIAESATGASAGVFGVSSSANGIGVVGTAGHNSGINIGVQGQTNSPSGYGGEFNNASTNGVALKTTTGKVQIDNLNGTGTRMVVANENGILSSQPIPSGGGSLDASYDFGGAGSGKTITADNGAVTIAGTDGLQVTGTTGNGNPLSLSGIGTRMFFYPKKAAFRAGETQGSEWDDVNIGDYSLATGYNAKASGVHDIAMGPNNTASGGQSVAIGSSNTSSATGAMTFGYGSSATANNATTIGLNNSASAVRATAIGSNVTASGEKSTALGYYTTAPSVGETTLGTFNTTYSPVGGSSTFNANDRLFSIGNGTFLDSRSNALTILKNGNAGFGATNETPTATVDIKGTFKLQGNGASSGRVLTSDANGNATWQPSSGVTYTSGSGITITGNTIAAVDNSATNELQTLSLSGSNLSLSNGGGSVVLPSSSFSLPYSGAASNTNAAVFSVTSTGTTAAIEGSNNTSTALNGTTVSGTALRGVASGSGGALFAQSNSGVAGQFISSAGTAVSALSSTIAGSFTSPSGTALMADGTIKLKTTGAAAGKFLKALDTNGTVEWADAPSGGGNGEWTVSGNDIYNSNTGKVLVGTTTSSTSGVMEVANNVSMGRVASFFNNGAAYMSVLNATENGTSGNPAGCDTCGGSKAINALSTYGDALFARSTNGRGIYLKGGNSTSFPAMLIETNAGAVTALEMTGKIKITDGTQGNGKVLTSDANGNASWVTPAAGGGGGSLDAAYDTGGAGAGRTVTADAGAVLVAGTDGLQVTGTLYSGTNLALSGAGARMFYYPKKGAFRAGTVDGSQWDNASVGEGSIGLGRNVTANGIYSVAIGQNASAGSESVAIGNFVTASTTGAAIGNGATASGLASVALGFYNTSSGDYATSMGYSNTSPSYGETVIGRFAANYSPLGGASSWNTADRLFVIGNGLTNASRSNALVVQKNGNLTISGEAYKAGGGSWTATSDARLKSDVVDYTDGLDKLMSIRPVKYHYNEKSGYNTQTEHIGVIAQDLQPVAPYMVSTFTKENTEYLQVDNSAMTYMLVNAVQEQQQLIDQQRKAIEELQKEKLSLKASIDAQASETESLKKDMAVLKAFLMPEKPTAANKK